MNDEAATFIVIMTILGLGAWLLNNWIKSRRPAVGDADSARQIEALKRENGRLHERLAVLERIATDPAQRTAREIEMLRQD